MVVLTVSIHLVEHRKVESGSPTCRRAKLPAGRSPEGRGPGGQQLSSNSRFLIPDRVRVTVRGCAGVGISVRGWT